MQLWQHIASEISQHTGRTFVPGQRLSIAGGCINQSFQFIDDSGEREFFIKLNSAGLLSMFEAETAALLEISNSQSVRVPQPVCTGVYQNQSYLVLEYLALGTGVDMKCFATQLAALHACTATQFGWQIDNTIGLTPQANQQHHDWLLFWREHRLGSQLALAADNGYGGELQWLGERLLADFPALFASYNPQPSMLHGDLWSGNYAGLNDGTPVIFDPALYYGDRETDLAMTTLFGGFGADFYAAYHATWPLDDGYAVRKTFYNIYHIINHLNLFGGGYQAQAVSMIRQVLAEL